MKLLIVEDKPENREAAGKYFATQNDVEVEFAPDYKSAMQCLAGADAVITDLYFRREVGSDDVTLGEELIERLASHNLAKMFKFIQPARDLIEELGKYIPLGEDSKVDENVLKWAVMEVEFGDYDGNPATNVLVEPLSAFAERRSKEEMLEYARDRFSSYENQPIMNKAYTFHKERHDRDVNALKEGPDSQPLGVLVMEEAREKGIPAIIATSTSHHGAGTDLVCTYGRDHNWPKMADVLFEGDPQKTEPQYWEEAHEDLNKVISRMQREDLEKLQS